MLDLDASVISMLANLLKQGGLTTLLALSMYVNYKLWKGKEELYDRLIESEEAKALKAEEQTVVLVTEMTKSRLVLEDLRSTKRGPPALPAPAPQMPALGTEVSVIDGEEER